LNALMHITAWLVAITIIIRFRHKLNNMMLNIWELRGCGSKSMEKED